MQDVILFGKQSCCFISAGWFTKFFCYYALTFWHFFSTFHSLDDVMFSCNRRRSTVVTQKGWENIDFRVSNFEPNDKLYFSGLCTNRQPKCFLGQLPCFLSEICTLGRETQWSQPWLSPTTSLFWFAVRLTSSLTKYSYI